MARLYSKRISFSHVPGVIDPLDSVLEVEVAVDNNGGEDVLPSAPPEHRRHQFYRVLVPTSAVELPTIRQFNIANMFADTSELSRATVLLCYCPSGVLRGVLTKDTVGWDFEPIPEEAVGDYNQSYSLRFGFASLDVCREVYGLILKLRRAEHAGQEYPGMDHDAARVVAHLMRCPLGPRVLEVAYPAQRHELKREDM